jgi:hypothetical protein
VAKAVRYKVKIYDAAGTTVLHTSIPLLLPSYPLGVGVLTDYATKKWTFTAYPDTACTAAYGVESAQVSITPAFTAASLEGKTLTLTCVPGRYGSNWVFSATVTGGVFQSGYTWNPEPSPPWSRQTIARMTLSETTGTLTVQYDAGGGSYPAYINASATLGATMPFPSAVGQPSCYVTLEITA